MNVDVLSWDERSVLADLGRLPPTIGAYLDARQPGVDPVDRYRGALIGLAVGNALGDPFVGLSPDTIKERHGSVNRYFTGPLPEFLLPPGKLSGDAQMALLLAGSIIAEGGFVPREFSRRLGAWQRVARRPEEATTLAAIALQRGDSWLRSGVDTVGNGAATRVVPIGLLHPTDIDMIRFDAGIQAMITNSNSTAIAAAVVMATAVAYLSGLSDGTFEPRHFLSQIERSLEGLADPELPLPHLGVRSTLLGRITVALDSVGRPASDAYADFGPSGSLLESLPAAIWAFGSSPDDPGAAIALAVSGGFAAGTVGAMTGALAGAYQGVSRLPRDLVGQLEYADGLAGHADELLALSGGEHPGQPLLQTDPLHPASYGPFRLGGSTMPTLEHAIRSSSAADPSMAAMFKLLPTPADARRLSAIIPLREDWSSTASGTIAAILRRRFCDEDDTGTQLVAASDEHLRSIGALFAADPFDYAQLLSERRQSRGEAQAL